jgi:mycothiol synthase
MTWTKLEDIARIAAAAEEADGAAPLDEATWLALRHHPKSVRSWVRDDGFALLIGTDLSLVVDPDVRGRGLGRSLLQAALPEDGEVRAWSHGDHPAAAALARSHGFERVRELWVMRRDMGTPLPAYDRDRVRSYRPSDADELIRVNAAAFAHHPEQGAMDAANLAERMAESWFDPAGLLVAMDGDRMLGFHWTKQHSPDLGEVYVVGIDPAAQGRGLGKLLTLAGLHHLADRGVGEVLLYVESDNAPAVAVYSGLGFRHAEADTHVMYRRG